MAGYEILERASPWVTMPIWHYRISYRTSTVRVTGTYFVQTSGTLTCATHRLPLRSSAVRKYVCTYPSYGTEVWKYSHVTYEYSILVDGTYVRTYLRT